MKPAGREGRHYNDAKPADPSEVARKLKSEYAQSNRDPVIRGLEGVQQLTEYVMREDLEFQETLQYVARLIFKQLDIKEVSIGLRSPTDGLYKYYAMHGMRSEVWEAHKHLAYTAEEFLDPAKYRGTRISPRTMLFLVEDNPYTEEELKTYGKYVSALQKRKSLDDTVEGDYLDVLMLNDEGKPIGWIETSGTWANKLPDAGRIKCLEAIASILTTTLPRFQGKYS